MLTSQLIYTNNYQCTKAPINYFQIKWTMVIKGLPNRALMMQLVKSVGIVTKGLRIRGSGAAILSCGIVYSLGS